MLQDRRADVGGEGDTLTVDRGSGKSARYRGVVIVLKFHWYEKHLNISREPSLGVVECSLPTGSVPAVLAITPEFYGWLAGSPFHVDYEGTSK